MKRENKFMNLKINKILLPIAIGAAVIIPTTAVLTSCSSNNGYSLSSYKAYTIADWNKKASDGKFNVTYKSLSEKIKPDTEKVTNKIARTEDAMLSFISDYLLAKDGYNSTAKGREQFVAYLALTNAMNYAQLYNLSYADKGTVKLGVNISELNYEKVDNLTGSFTYDFNTNTTSEPAKFDIGKHDQDASAENKADRYVNMVNGKVTFKDKSTIDKQSYNVYKADGSATQSVNYLGIKSTSNLVDDVYFINSFYGSNFDDIKDDFVSITNAATLESFFTNFFTKVTFNE